MQVLTVVNKMNINELDNIYNILVNNDVKYWRLNNIDSIGRAKESKLLLTDDELNKMYQFIRDKRFDSTVSMNIQHGCSHFMFDYENELRDYYYTCLAGIRVASIKVNGDITACLDIENAPIQGNINSDNFNDIWNKEFRIYRQNKALTCETCNNCEYCNVCRGDSWHTWDFENNKPNFCAKNIIRR